MESVPLPVFLHLECARHTFALYNKSQPLFYFYYCDLLLLLLIFTCLYLFVFTLSCIVAAMWLLRNKA